MKYAGIKTIPLTLERRGEKRTDPTQTITLDRVLVQVTTTTEDSGTYDELTDVQGVTVHVASPSEPTVQVGDRFRWCGQPYAVTSVQPSIMEQNKVVYVPFVWQFKGKLVTR